MMGSRTSMARLPMVWNICVILNSQAQSDCGGWSSCQLVINYCKLVQKIPLAIYILIDDLPYDFGRVVLHLFTGSLVGIGKLPVLAGWYIWFGITAYSNFLPLA
jgi:hypothetical protein